VAGAGPAAGAAAGAGAGVCAITAQPANKTMANAVTLVLGLVLNIGISLSEDRFVVKQAAPDGRARCEILTTGISILTAVKLLL
jgi:hypothetical protein